MNKLTFLIILLCCLSLMACNKEKNQKAQIVIDCTGIYLRLDGLDYHVCNLDKVSSFSDGESVTVTYRKLSQCNGSAQSAFVCEMLHANEGWIEVTEIK